MPGLDLLSALNVFWPVCPIIKTMIPNGFIYCRSRRTCAENGLQLACELRRAGISAAMDYSDKSLKSQMKRADKLNSSYTLIFGDKEIDEKRVELRNMNTKNQQVLPIRTICWSQ